MKNLLHKILFPSKVAEIKELTQAANTLALRMLDIPEDKPLDLEKIYNDNKHFFELMLTKDFTGFIPKQINEPTLKIFGDQAEMFEKWIMWQSWYINRKAMNDPVKIGFYNGMMVYLKVLLTIATINKRVDINDRPVKIPETKVEVPWIDQAIGGLEEFKKGRDENHKTNKTTKAEVTEDTQS